MKGIQSVKDNVPAMSKEDGTLTETDKETADELIKCFYNMFTRGDSNSESEQSQDSEENHSTWDDADLDFSADIILKKLQRIKAEKSQGPDGIHPMLLKSCASAVAMPLSLIFASSLETGIVPEDWKSAEIVPIYKKKGSRTEPTNYRPISLTAVVCKVMESLIKDRIVDYVENNRLMTKHQHGFVKHRSCLTNLLETFEAWTEALNEGYGVDVIYLDYRKAFDSVSHKKLITKLKMLGLRGKLLRWIEQFLTGRKMRVGIRGTFSMWIWVLSGVPQGSVLGPLLFLLFVNDLPEWIISSIKMFADDTKIWRTLKTESDGVLLQSDIDSLLEWSKKWQLTFNPEKCKTMHLGHGPHTEYHMVDAGNRIKLAEVDTEKDLGIYVTSDLKSSAQCAQAVRKANSVLAMVRRNFKRLDAEDFLVIYKAYIRPHLEYAIQAWSPHLRKDIDSLEKIQ